MDDWPPSASASASPDSGTTSCSPSHARTHARRRAAGGRTAASELDGQGALPARRRAPVRRRLRQAPARERRPRALARPRVRRTRLPARRRSPTTRTRSVKRLTAIASLLLVPTFIVGIYGQNFETCPEIHWGIWGYTWSWGLIVVDDAAPDLVLPPQGVALRPHLRGYSEIRAVLHLPELQGAVGRPRSPHEPARPDRSRLQPLRLRVPVRADGRLLPGADDRLRRLRPGRAASSPSGAASSS